MPDTVRLLTAHMTYPKAGGASWFVCPMTDGAPLLAAPHCWWRLMAGGSPSLAAPHDWRAPSLMCSMADGAPSLTVPHGLLAAAHGLRRCIAGGATWLTVAHCSRPPMADSILRVEPPCHCIDRGATPICTICHEIPHASVS